MNNHVEDIIPLSTMLREFRDETLALHDKELAHIENRLRLLNNRLVGQDTVSDVAKGFKTGKIHVTQATRVLRALGLFMEEINDLLHKD